MLKGLSSLKKENHYRFDKLRWPGQPEEKVDGLNAADDGESSEEPHGSSDQTQLRLKLHLLVLLDVVKGCRVKVDLHQMKCWLLP